MSHTLFDKRNDKRYKYDEEMVNTIHIEKAPTLYVIHLWGQHYTYRDRFPDSFKKFTAVMYDRKYDLAKRQIMADYDNATLYNDYVVNSIIEKFKNQYCCIFYFSDHGEEVYELRNFMGHGTAMDSPNANYQIRVPLMVWLSPSYKSANPLMVKKLSRAKDYPICMDDIGHTLLDVSGIRCKYFAPSRSFVNAKFNQQRHRIVLHSVDYDRTLYQKR